MPETTSLAEELLRIDIRDCKRFMRRLALRHGNGLLVGSAIAAWLTPIQSARLHEVEPFAYVSSPPTRTAEYRDTPESRRSAEGAAFLRGLLPAAWVSRNPACRLLLSR